MASRDRNDMCVNSDDFAAYVANVLDESGDEESDSEQDDMIHENNEMSDGTNDDSSDNESDDNPPARPCDFARSVGPNTTLNNSLKHNKPNPQPLKASKTPSTPLIIKNNSERRSNVFSVSLQNAKYKTQVTSTSDRCEGYMNKNTTGGARQTLDGKTANRTNSGESQTNSDEKTANRTINRENQTNSDGKTAN
ncbi:hypothetical protein J6590_060578 [Homalodisca vitripennis]|nr:hypothetical protein J6590_060578 [Homalodisca vitripennis]